MENYLNLRETAEILKLSRKTVYKMVLENEIPAAKIGGNWRIPEQLLKDLILGSALEQQIKFKLKVTKELQDKVAELELKKFEGNSYYKALCEEKIRAFRECIHIVNNVS